MLEDIYKEVMTDLRKKYKRQALTLQETASELGISVGTLRNGIKENKNIPPYRIVGGGVKRKKYAFAIHSVARFLSTAQIVY